MYGDDVSEIFTIVKRLKIEKPCPVDLTVGKHAIAQIFLNEGEWTAKISIFEEKPTLEMTFTGEGFFGVKKLDSEMISDYIEVELEPIGGAPYTREDVILDKDKEYWIAFCLRRNEEDKDE